MCVCVLLIMGGVTTRNMYSSLQKYNKYIYICICMCVYVCVCSR